MTYGQKLNNPKWQVKRLFIFNRDGFCCVSCGSGDNELHVHHTEYIKGREPWDYPDELLKTLCYKCHKNEHAEPIAPQRNEAVEALAEPITDYILRFCKNELSKKELFLLINRITAPKYTVLNALAISLRSEKLRQLAHEDARFYIQKFVALNEVKMAFVKINKIKAIVLAA